MIRPLKPHVIALVCSAGLLAASGPVRDKPRRRNAARARSCPQPTAAAVESAAPTAQPVAATYGGANRSVGRPRRPLSCCRRC
jgi:hypothetical protein